jgi:cytochrome P450
MFDRYFRAMTRNETMYPSPNSFNPERFFGPEKMASEACQQVEAVFGFGRRICPGRFFAEANIWILMTNMIATMDISKAVDEKGKEINVTGEYVGSFVR